MVYYIGYYNCDIVRSEERIVAPAAENKMSYVVSALTEVTDDRIEVVSPAETKLPKLIKGKKRKINEQVVLKTFASFNSKNKLIRALGHLLTRISVCLYLMTNIKARDHMIVYHSLAYMNLIRIIKRIKKSKLTIEVEELYSDVTEDEQLRKREISYLQIADNYIFITQLLRKQVNTEKEYAISHGTYKPIPNMGFRFEDGKVHVVYAGTFRQAKGGAITAISAAEYLNKNYVLEILGGGSDAETKAVEEYIQEVAKKTDCKIKYVGFKTGDAFNSYIQACHIGLSTQQADAKFNATSFPSKVLMYMSNGIKVVSIRIPAVETSDVRAHIYYYDVQDAKAIAEVIKSVPIDNEYSSREILNALHKEFVERLNNLLRR